MNLSLTRVFFESAPTATATVPAAIAPSIPLASPERDRVQQMQEAIDLLPDFCREVFLLRRFHQLSHPEIARRLGVSETVVNAQLVLGMNRCRQYLRSCEAQRGFR